MDLKEVVGIMTRKVFNHIQNEKYTVQNIVENNKGRHYQFEDELYPSITTILGYFKNKSPGLVEWRKRVGEKEAQKISTLAARKGTNLHNIVEKYLMNETIEYSNPTTKSSFLSIKKYLDNIDNIMYIEDPFYSKQYRIAGRPDVIAEYMNVPSVIDFKTSSRNKNKEWIEDYYLQIAAYAMAHDYVYGSEIKQGVIMVCTPDLYYQEFKVEGPELRRWKHAFLKRLDMYHDLINDEKEKANVKITEEEFK